MVVGAGRGGGRERRKKGGGGGVGGGANSGIFNRGVTIGMTIHNTK